jgi:hypothetical protein
MCQSNAWGWETIPDQTNIIPALIGQASWDLSNCTRKQLNIIEIRLQSLGKLCSHIVEHNKCDLCTTYKKKKSDM